MSDASGPLTDDDIAHAARSAPIAQRTDVEVERAAERFATATQERALLRTRATGRGGVARMGVAIVVVAAIAVAAFLLGRGTATSRDVRPIEVHPGPGASLERIDNGSVRGARLYEGSATFSVPSSSTERFVVVTGDATVEGHGVFDVTATSDKVARVRVIDGDAHIDRVDGSRVDVTPASPWMRADH